MNDVLATIERIDNVKHHPNADRLDIVDIGNFSCITGRDSFKVGDLCVFVKPDSVLPDQEWALPYKKFCKNRIKAQKIRDMWSFGLVLPLNEIGIIVLHPEYEVGMDVTNFLQITKYVGEIENKLDVRRCGLPFSIPKTDESSHFGVRDLHKYFGQPVDISVKVDGQSFSAYFRNGEFGICSRSNDYKLDSENRFTAHNERYHIEKNLSKFCKENKVNLAIRGESYGPKIQGFKHNVWSKRPYGLVLFSVWNIDEMRYERIDSPLYIHKIAPKLNIPTVPLLEQNVLFSREHIEKYKYAETIDYGEGEVPFEGVVVQSSFGSFKIINMDYDSKK